jgi:hypothetical protein
MTGFKKLFVDTYVLGYATRVVESLVKNIYMNNSSTSKANCLNVQLVNNLVQIIRSLSNEERKLLEQELLFDGLEPPTQELMNLAQNGGSFDFLYDEADIYSLQDGEPV